MIRAAVAAARTERAAEGGMSLVLCVTLLFAVLAFTGVMLLLAQNEEAVAEHAMADVRATASAEGATQTAAKAVLDAAASWAPLATTLTGEATVGGRSVPYTIVPNGGPYQKTVSGQQATCRQYAVTVSDTIGSATARIERVIEIATTHAFQYAVLYDSDLEVFPAAPMTLSGPFHTNGDLYIGYNNAAGAFKLDTTYVRAAGAMYRHTKYDPSKTHTGALQVNKAGGATFPTWPLTLDSPDATFVDDIDALYAGSVLSGAGGALEVALPPIESTAPGDYYDSQAGLTIRDGVATFGGVNVTAVLEAAGALSPVTFYDGRQKTNVTCTQLDVSLLGSYFPANGLIYVSRSEATPAAPNGVRIKGASTLPGAMTVASPNPVYVLGNFNTTATKPAANVSDAMNVLSNAWNDTKVAGTLPLSSDTTYNVAFVTGNNTTTPGSYNGGLENLPRLHEDWTGKKCTILGAFACLWRSAIGTSKTSDHKPPQRLWSYDTSLALTPPPYTPVTVRISNNTQWTD